MDLNPFFKSVLEQDTAAIVLCNRNRETMKLYDIG